MTGSLSVPRCNRQITEVGGELDLPDTVLEDAQANFLRAINIWALESRGHDNLAVASLVLAAQQNNHPLTMDETYNLWNDASDSDKIKKSFGKNAADRALNAMKDEFDIDTEFVGANAFIQRYADVLDLPEELEDVALEMYSILADENHPAVGNYSQRCVAAGIIYLAARVNNLQLTFTQHNIADATDVAAVTIRNRYQGARKALVEVLSERGDLPYDLVEDAMAALEDDDASEKKLFDQALAAYSDFTIPDEVINRTGKEQAGWPEDLGDLPGIGGNRADRLREAGYDTIGSLYQASDEDLKQLDRIGDAAIKVIRNGLEELEDIHGPHPIVDDMDGDESGE